MHVSATRLALGNGAVIVYDTSVSCGVHSIKYVHIALVFHHNRLFQGP